MAALADRQLDTPSTGSIGTRTERNSEGAKSMSTGADALKRPYRPTRLGPEVVTPLSGPAHVYGPSGVAKARWRKPLPAIIADAMTNSIGARHVHARHGEHVSLPSCLQHSLGAHPPPTASPRSLFCNRVERTSAERTSNSSSS